MTEEILFSDMVNHYSLKLSEISDILTDAVSYLNKSVAIANDSWSSESSNSFSLKVAQIQKHIIRSNAAIDELTKLFNTVKNDALNSEIERLKNETDSLSASAQE